MAEDDREDVVVSLSGAVAADLDRIGDAVQLDRASLIRLALDHYLAGEGADILAEAQGLAELDRGESVDLDDTLAKARQAIAAAESNRQRRAG